MEVFDSPSLPLFTSFSLFVKDQNFSKRLQYIPVGGYIKYL